MWRKLHALKIIKLFCKSFWQFFGKSVIELPRDPTILLLRILKRHENICHTKIHMNILIASFRITKKKPKWLTLAILVHLHCDCLKQIHSKSITATHIRTLCRRKPTFFMALRSYCHYHMTSQNKFPI